VGDAKDAPERDRVEGAARFVGSNNAMWQRAKAEGLPTWAWRAVALLIVVGVSAALAVYFASRSLLAAGVIAGVFWLSALAVVNFGDLSRRKL
jgi:hypothetical protein